VQVLQDIGGVGPDLRGAAVTIGNFDGMHLGHQALLRDCLDALARGPAGGGPVVAITFEPHPIAILAPERSPPRLTAPDEKLRLLDRYGADAVLVLRADRTLLSMSAEAFIEEMVVGPFGPRCVVEGPTFGFGRGRKGNVDTLRDLGRRFGFDVHVSAPVELDFESPEGRQIVSSTLIRSLLERGDVARAATCLGRPYALCGPVIHGAGVGKSLGFPTINIDAGEQQLPADGVYAGLGRIGGRCCAAAISIGRRPTFGGTDRVVEAFLLDAAGEWYGEEARLEFLAWLREQRVFGSPEALAEQIENDVKAVRKVATAHASQV